MTTRFVPEYGDMDPRQVLLGSFHAAIAAADPAIILPAHLPSPPNGRTLAVGGGKAAASMAVALEKHWPHSAPLSGLVVTRYQHGLPTRLIEVIEASHPLPDGRGEIAARRILKQSQTLGRDDLLLALISGGGSSLLAAPAAGVTLKELRHVTRGLLRSGATIQDINTVRKHLTCVSGGQLARSANGAHVLALIVSDVAGDDPTHIASGPCAPDPSTFQDAVACLRQHAINVPASIKQHLSRGVAGLIEDTPKADHPCFGRTENRVIANSGMSLNAAAAYFDTQGIKPIILSDRVSGDVHNVAKTHVALMRSLGKQQKIALISGGETTLRVHNPSGRGGRNTAYLLALALTLGNEHGLWALAADTDGIDGTEDNAGAILSPDTLQRSHALSLDARRMLENNNTFEFFASLGDLVYTGPSRTNVNDYRVLLIN